MTNRYCIRTGHLPVRRIRRSSLTHVRDAANRATQVRCFQFLVTGR